LGAITKRGMKEKTVTRREYNPEEEYYEWKEIKTGKYVFDEEDKIAIVREYRRDNPAPWQRETVGDAEEAVR